MNNTYTVKPGDTLYGISNQYGVSAIDLYNYNNLTTTNIKVGQVLRIPNTTGTNPSGLFTYTVKKGDTLYNIAKRYNTTADEIIKLSHLTSTNLYIGQELTIPETNETTTTLPSFINYTVKKGDTLYNIARTYNISVDDLIKDNNLNTSILSIGQNLKIRTNKSDIAVEECFGEAYTPIDNTTTYKVVKGDSLWKIANKFNTSVDAIKRKNNLTSNNLSIGQILKI